MRAPARMALAQQPLLSLIAPFCAGEHGPLPTVEGEQPLVGVITQTDLVRALASAITPAP